MKRIGIILILLSGMLCRVSQSAEYPQAEISNGILKAHIYLPDKENSFYNATRFDWSGVISSLTYKGHTYFGKWNDEENPLPDAAITGPVEAYFPLNYSEVGVGGHFIKIGVGTLVKVSDEKHADLNSFPIADLGKWKIKKKADEVQFIHVLHADDYSYEYRKTVHLVADQPTMVISHSLKNTGKKRIDTFGYNHNFFVIDNQPIDKGFELTFPVNVSGVGRGSGDIFEIRGNKIIFKRVMDESETFACKYLEGLKSVKDFDVRLDNLNTGAGVRITGNQPLSRFRLWGNSKTVCPETYIDLKIEPGEEFSWSYFYEFYESDSMSQ